MTKIELSKRLSLIVLVLLLTVFVPQITLAKSSRLLHSEEGIVVKVSDGDTLKVTTDNATRLRVRLAGVDCPETPKLNKKTGAVNKPGQLYGENAAAFTTDMALNKKVRLDIYAVDQYSRVLSFVFVGGKNLNLELVKAGLAEVYRNGEYGQYKRDIEDAERFAKSKRRGMWLLGASYESPREFRKRMKMRGK